MCDFNLPTREFEPVTSEFELVTRVFELVTRRFELVTRGFELVTRALLFHVGRRYICRQDLRIRVLQITQNNISHPNQ